jgi:hypothetical protein
MKKRTMKDRQISGCLAILILGFLLTSGCSGTESSGNTVQPASPTTATVAPAAEPVLTPSPQIVYETVFVPSTTAMVAPAAEPVLTPSLPIVYETAIEPPTTVPTTVRAADTSPYVEPTSPYNNLKPELSADGVSGTLITRVTGCSSNILTVFVARAGTNVSPMDDRYLLDRMVVGEQNADFLPVKILPDGSSEIVRLAPGTYTAYLPDKTASEIEEQQTFRIGADVMTYLSFNGSSYSNPGSSGSSCRRR